MNRQSRNRLSALQAQRLKNVTSDPARKPRHENGGEYDGPNKTTRLESFLDVMYRLPDRRKVEGE